MRDVILHAFNWPYAEVAARARAIAEIGYGAVLFAPPLYSDQYGADWWQRYQPKDYRVVRSFLGGKEELERAIKALHGENVRAYTDLVFNHMANEKGGRADPYNFPGEAELARYRSEREAFERDRLYGDLNVGLFSPWDFNQDGDIHNWNDPHESQ
ncbi:MAG: alpha-amylase family glycosyl hydrolase, partial [Geobacteraceae bacterium]|nr:alpha-amylase family glycosyl hydrolase [Geobacteraceae bacterium]